MKYIKKVSKSIIYTLGSIIILTIILTILNYFGILSGNIISIVKIIIMIVSFLVGGYLIGLSSINKGWLEGLKLGIIYIFISFILKGILNNNWFDIKDFLYYLIIILSTIFGSILGINKKKN